MSKCYDNPYYDDLGSDIQNAWEQHKPEQHVELINDNIEEFDKAIELFKQETLEEAIENRIKGINVDTGFRIERSYSEEDMIEFAYNYMEERKNKGVRALMPELLIKQFKKL